MGSNQSATANWTVNDWAFGTGENAATMDDVVNELKKVPKKYFGGDAIQNDPSMNKLQQDLLAFDETLKGVFRRKKRRPQENDVPTGEEYDYYEEDQSGAFAQPIDSEQEPTYLQPIYNQGVLPPTTNSAMNASRYSSQQFWRCGNCTAENTISERVCRRCGHTETRL